MAMATQLLFIPITAFTKVSILLTYLRTNPIPSCHMSADMIFRNIPLANQQELLLHSSWLHGRVVVFIVLRGLIPVQVSISTIHRFRPLTLLGLSKPIG
jgi:hypothetical protein